MRPVDRSLVAPEDYEFRRVEVTVDQRDCGGPGGKCCPFNLASPRDFPFVVRWVAISNHLKHVPKKGFETFQTIFAFILFRGGMFKKVVSLVAFSPKTRR